MRAGVGAVWAFWRGLRLFTERALVLTFLGLEGFAAVLEVVVCRAARAGAAKAKAAKNTSAAVSFEILCARIFLSTRDERPAQRNWGTIPAKKIVSMRSLSA